MPSLQPSQEHPRAWDPATHPGALIDNTYNVYNGMYQYQHARVCPERLRGRLPAGATGCGSIDNTRRCVSILYYYEAVAGRFSHAQSLDKVYRYSLVIH